MEQCPVVRRLQNAGINQLGADAIIGAVGDSLHMPGGCQTDEPVESTREPGVMVCGLYYAPEVAAGVAAVTAVLEQGLAQAAPELTVEQFALY
jgi:hypothetical protein